LAEVLSPKPSRPIADLDTAISGGAGRAHRAGALAKMGKAGRPCYPRQDDNTRLTPADRIIPPCSNGSTGRGAPDDRISCIMALGTHRYMTDDEMDR
jgi:hypothetical protein